MRASTLTSLLLLALCLPAPARAGSIWQSSPPLSPVLTRARAEGKRVLIKVGTSWCGACRRQDAELARPEMVRFLGDFYRLAYDAEQGEGRDVAGRFNVVGFPTLLLVDGQARELGRVTGHKPAAELRAALEALQAGKGDLKKKEARLARLLAAGKEDLDLRLVLGKAWALRGDKARALGHLLGPIALGGERAPRALLIRGKYLELLSLRQFGQARVTLETLRKTYPNSRSAARAAVPLARALHGLGKTRAAIKLLRPWARGESDREQAAAWFCLHHADRPRCAEGHARRALKLTPDSANAHALYGLALGRRGKLPAAIRAMGRAVELDPEQGNYRRSLELFRRTLTRKTRIKR